MYLRELDAPYVRNAGQSGVDRSNEKGETAGLAGRPTKLHRRLTDAPAAVRPRPTAWRSAWVAGQMGCASSQLQIRKRCDRDIHGSSTSSSFQSFDPEISPSLASVMPRRDDGRCLRARSSRARIPEQQAGFRQRGLSRTPNLSRSAKELQHFSVFV